jgi:Cu2+-exporting ATPase
MRQMHAEGRRVHLLSGDSVAATTAVADSVGIANSSGDASPSQKVDYVRRLQQSGAVVAMIGDGVNDAPSLAVADVSIAMGSGTDVAQSAADLLLLSRNLTAIPEALRTARRAKRIMRENFAWAALYNLIAIPVAAAGYVSPWMAALGMSVSSFIVVANAVRLVPRARPH